MTPNAVGLLPISGRSLCRKEGEYEAEGLTRFLELENEKEGKNECQRFDPLFKTRKQKGGKNVFA
jgi:hypothetical protein